MTERIPQWLIVGISCVIVVGAALAQFWIIPYIAIAMQDYLHTEIYQFSVLDWCLIDLGAAILIGLALQALKERNKKT